METKQGIDRLAVLIDADQGQHGVLQELMSEISRYGTGTIKRAYGDWTEQYMSEWKGLAQANAMQTVQQFRYTKRKNAIDFVSVWRKSISARSATSWAHAACGERAASGWKRPVKPNWQIEAVNQLPSFGGLCRWRLPMVSLSFASLELCDNRPCRLHKSNCCRAEISIKVTRCILCQI